MRIADRQEIRYLYMSDHSFTQKKIVRHTHDVVWDKEKIASYWDVFGNIKPVSPWFSVKASGWLLKKINQILKNKRNNTNTIKILDMGSGSGEFINMVSQQTGCQCYGIDLSDERVAIASAEFPAIKFSTGSLTDTGHKSEYFDLIISTQTIGHLLDEDLEQAFAEMQRILKPGGTVFLTTRFEEDLQIGRKVCPDCHAVFLHSQHIQSFTSSRLRRLLDKQGIETIEDGRSRCRDNIHEYVPRRFGWMNLVLYRIFGNYLDERVGKYLYSIATKPPST